MGVNPQGQQSAQPNLYNQQSALTPQQQVQMQQLQGLNRAAATPYQGTAAGGGASQGIAQLVAALMAKQKAQQLQQQWQNQSGAPNPSAPGAGSGMAPQTMNAQPMPTSGAQDA